MRTIARAPAGRDRGLMVMTGLALVTSLLLGGAATASWLRPAGLPRPTPAASAVAASASPAPPSERTPTPDGAPCMIEPGRRGLVGPPAVRWRFLKVGAIFAPPALADDVLFLASWAGNVHAVDARTGLARWRYAMGGLLDESPVLDADTVYVSGRRGAVHALDATTGRPRWRVETAGHPAAAPVLVDDVLLVVSGPHAAPPAVAGDTAYVGGGDDALFVQALDTLTGAELWRASLAQNGLSALDVATGTGRWHFFTRRTVAVSPVIDGGWLYVVDDDALHKFEAASGRERWQVAMKSDAVVRAMAAEGMIYLATDHPARTGDDPMQGVSGWLYAFDGVAGAESWRFPTGGVSWSVPVIAGDTVYVGGYDGNLYALDGATGEERWQLELGGHLVTPVVACGALYVGSYHGSLAAIANE